MKKALLMEIVMLSLLLRALRGAGLLGEEERLARSMIGWSRSLGEDHMWKVCLLFCFFLLLFSDVRCEREYTKSTKREWQSLKCRKGGVSTSSH